MKKYFLPLLFCVLFIVDCILLVILVFSIISPPKVSYFESKEEVFKEDIKRISEIELFPKVKKYEIKLTSYNSEFYQTDFSPCISSIGFDICTLYTQGIQPIALSQDMIFGTKGNYCRKDCPFIYGDKIKVTSENPQCNFEAVVLDTMNARHKMSGDIFYPFEYMNTSCIATIEKIQ
jgi:hypothetical protein